jgi:diguanylate cyclase (GGDEF)-like protein
MCKKALILQIYQKTEFFFETAIEACNDFVFHSEENLADAIGQLISCRFDYIICCEHLPEDALNSLEQLKRAYEVPFDTRILAFSSNPERLHKEQALALGIIDFHDINQVENYDDFFQTMPVTTTTGNILLVNESEEEARQLISLFKQNSHIVSHFVDIKVAHDAAKHDHFDLLIVDLFLLSNYLNKIQLIDLVSTLVLSNHNKTELLIDLMQLGVTDVINKPIVPEAFLLRVEHILKTNQLHRDELDNKTQHLLELSVKDALTGAYNRRYLGDVIEQRVNFLKRHSEPFGILILDVDNFKQINDTLGHQAGDNLLIQLVSLIQNYIRNIDCCCRYGGEEFVIILTGCELDDAMYKAERIRQKVEETGMTVSIGVAVFDDASQNLLIEERINFADLALYQAKKSGKNQVILYSVD